MRFLTVTVCRGAFRGLLLLVLTVLGSWSSRAAGISAAGFCGTYPGRVVDELARHQQFVQQRIRQGFRTLATAAPPAALDVGNIAVLPDDGTLVTPANSFDLDQRTLTLTPESGVFAIQAGTSQFDASAAEQGILLNPSPAANPDNIGDDGTREVSLGFSFPFYGEQYNSVFINSDGNLTFQNGDTAHSERVLSRVLSGSPRIAPYFADLDPSVAGQLTYLSSDSRFVVTWSSVPDYSDSGIGPRETVQVELLPDGVIRFSYNGINGRESVVGVSPGNFSGTPALVDWSQATGQTAESAAVAEIFTRSTQLDLAAVAQSFYETHDDAYEFLVIFTTFDFDLGGAFAFEVNIANDVTGIGRVSEPPVFDFSSSYGSSRLESLLNMGNLSKYPSDPEAVFLRSVDSTLSIMGQEAGHRFLSYVRWNDPEGSAGSTALLGRDLQHWSFFFNSDASVVEGNRIRDNGNGTFTTIGAVEYYSDLDQYLMGLRPPEEVAGTFLVENPISSFRASSAPQTGVNFSGTRANVTVDQIIAANGPRVPSVAVAPKNFNFAFVLVSPRNTTPSEAQVAHLDRIRTRWEEFFNRATSFRGKAHTSLTRALSWAPRTFGLLAGTSGEVQIELQEASASDFTVTLASSNSAAVSVPDQVLIPAGSISVSIPVTAVAAGTASVTATAPGFETGTAVVTVLADLAAGDLALSLLGGDRQIGLPGTTLPQPISAILRDNNQVPYSGVQVDFAVAQGDAALSSPGGATDTAGRISTEVTLGPASGPITVTATIPGTDFRVEFSLFAVEAADVPAAGIVDGASFLRGPLAAGSIISIFGVNLAATEATASSLPLPSELAGASVEIAGLTAPLYYVSPVQINVQVPTELTGIPSTTLIVRNGASASNPVSLSLGIAGPGIFAQDSSGSGPGAITHTVSNLLVTSELPASAGEFVQIYAAGLGEVAPFLPSGQPAPQVPLSRTLSLPSVTMNGVTAPVSFSGLAPGFVGLYQVNAQVPEGVHGTVSVVVTVEGIASNAVTMEVR